MPMPARNKRKPVPLHATMFRPPLPLPLPTWLHSPHRSGRVASQMKPLERSSWP